MGCFLSLCWNLQLLLCCYPPFFCFLSRSSLWKRDLSSKLTQLRSVTSFLLLLLSLGRNLRGNLELLGCRIVLLWNCPKWEILLDGLYLRREHIHCKCFLKLAKGLLDFLLSKREGKLLCLCWESCWMNCKGVWNLSEWSIRSPSSVLFHLQLTSYEFWVCLISGQLDRDDWPDYVFRQAKWKDIKGWTWEDSWFIAKWKMSIWSYWFRVHEVWFWEV